MLSEIQHFGITIVNPIETLRFYNGVLRFPFPNLNVVTGSLFDRIYKLKKVATIIAWHQFTGTAAEFFYVPTHPARNAGVSDIFLPGFRYAAYRAEGIDEYIERFDARNIPWTATSRPGARTLRVQDPTGIHVLLCEDTSGGRTARVTGLVELGLTVADPLTYEAYFQAIGLPPAADSGPADIIELFDPGQPVITCRYGHIRLLHFPESGVATPQHSYFPYNGTPENHHFNDAGIKHIAYEINDIDTFYEKASAAGVHFLFKPTLVTGGSRIAYFLDPEGNTIEVMQLAPGAREAMNFMGELRKAEITLRSALSGIIRKL